MYFSCRSDILNVFFPPLSLPHCHPAEANSHITSDYIVLLMEQFASQFCQHRSGEKPPPSTVSAGHLAPFISPLMPFNSIAMTTDTHALPGFMMMVISLLKEEWGGPVRKGLLCANSGSHQSEYRRRRPPSL